ncbi:DUF4124 domain-containing protein [Aquipseudomonas ullengensis]|uniref:DUF4124 domain-containing protein n=1 Tax=Aquipseudomonas ullengensis TaxID=2759166 RepID=A0A7W4QFL9_9GAMM|nr:DUF4124 domain-containing protein [Pseudomonas ullengensis]MBB2496788.1 DUF4124 domain-containing protein [Pseudomonas ullengensis]
MRQLFFCLLICLLPLHAHAGVYTYIDADGNRVYTDQPRSDDAEQIQLAPSNNMSGGTQIQPPTVPLTMEEPKPPAYQLLRILIPEPDVTIREITGNMIVTLTSEPSLLPGHSYRLLLDGQIVGTPGRSPVFPLENIDRGTHQLSAEIIDASGRILERTPSQPFHMKRISLAEKRRAHPCKKADYGVRPECPIEDKPKEPRDIPLIPFI